MVVFNKLRQFQDLGHEAILIIGDFTTLIGDPSGSSTRPVLTREEIVENAQTYLDQAFKILDEHKTTVVYNSERFNDGLRGLPQASPQDDHGPRIERDDFAKRYASNARSPSSNSSTHSSRATTPCI